MMSQQCNGYLTLIIILLSYNKRRINDQSQAQKNYNEDDTDDVQF